MTVVHSTLTGADLHDPKAHGANHESGGADEINTLGQLDGAVIVKMSVPEFRLIGTETNAKDYHLIETGGFIVLQVNNGTEESPSWANVVTVDSSAVVAARLRVNDGSASAPTVTFSGDPNTGFYRFGNDQVGVSGDVIMAAGKHLFVGDTVDSNVTTGITINKGAETDLALTVKGSNVAHGLTSTVETDTFFAIGGNSGGRGGGTISAIAEDDVNQQQVFVHSAYGGEASSNKTLSSVGLHQFYAFEISGGALANITANGNVFCISARVGGATVARMLVDEDGEIWAVSATVTAFDEYDDSQLVRALSVATGDVIRSQFDEFLRYGEDDLVQAGILGDTIDNGGLLNVTGLQRLHNGAIWQLYTKMEEQAKEIAALKQLLLKGEA